MHNRNGRVLRILENLLDMIINFLVLLYSYVALLAESRVQSADFFDLGTLFYIFILSAASAALYRALNFYKPTPHIGRGFPYYRLALANMVYFSSVLVLSAWLKNDGNERFLILWLSFSGVFSSLLLIFKKYIIVSAVRLFRRRRADFESVILVGDNKAAALAFMREASLSGTVTILGCVGCCGLDADLQKLGEMDELDLVLDKHRPGVAVFAVDYCEPKQLAGLVNFCDERCVRVYFLPALFGFFKSVRQVEEVGALPLINLHATPLLERRNALKKRALDLLGSIFLIIFTFPVMLWAAVGVRLSSPGPILFKQTRVGRMGRHFTMLKFRSMRENGASDTAWTTGTDPRKTRFGAFIRRTSIDELPQLFNVLFGSMSLVGPRPELPHFVNEFKSTVPLYMIKHYVKPGITGLAQIKGLRGDTSIEDRIEADIDYIENWSFLLDLSILFKTPLRAFNPSERYVGEDGNGDSSAGGESDEE